MAIPGGSPTVPAGFVLAGGRSSRMGRNKALLPETPVEKPSGLSLIERICRRVAAVTQPVTIIGATEIYQGLGFPVEPDIHPGCGPLSGIETALTITSADWNLVVACDMPLASPDLFAKLLGATDPGVDCILPVRPDGFLEPLCAVYHRRALQEVENALRRGEYKVTAALNRLQVHHFALDNENDVVNINTPEDYRMFLENRRG